jgi:hypothetical protein
MISRTWLKLAVVATATTVATLAIAADHLDSPKPKANAAADITDVYTWIDGERVVITLNVFPIATIESKFDDKVQYWVHTTSGTAFGEKKVPLDIVCTFDAAQTIQCWAGGEYVTGNAGVEAGISSQNGLLKVFAGLRDDPFYFNLAGFKATTDFVTANAGALMFDPAGCPKVDAALSTTLQTMLKENGNSMPGTDFFAGKNVLAIVLSLDKKFMTEGGPIMSVWGSTRVAN